MNTRRHRGRRHVPMNTWSHHRPARRRRHRHTSLKSSSNVASLTVNPECSSSDALSPT